MSNLSRLIVPLVCGGWMLAAPSPFARAADPEVTVKTEESWFKSTHIINLNKEAAVILRDAVDRVNPKLISGALTSATSHPALKILLTLMTNNADAFKKALNKEGVIGPNGIAITLTAHGGKVAKNMPDLTTRMPSPLGKEGEKAVLDAMQIAVNPWSWNIAPRE